MRNLVLFLFQLVVVSVISVCVPVKPCTTCSFMAIVKDDWDCQLYHYCYFGRVWTTRSCGYNQIYSTARHGCVPFQESKSTLQNGCRSLPRIKTQTPIINWNRRRSSTPRAVFWRQNNNNKQGNRVSKSGFSFDVTTATPKSPQHVVTSKFKQKEKCGIKVTTYIVGGHNADRAEWAWQVSLQAYDVISGQFQHVCGGTLIHRSWVITAAHCLYNSKAKINFIIVAGQYRLRSNDPWRQIRGIDKTILHYGYRHRGNYPNDIALIRLSAPFDLTTAVRPACLPDQTQFQQYSTSQSPIILNSGDGSSSSSSSSSSRDARSRIGLLKTENNSTKCWTTGYGKGENRQILREVSVRFLDWSQCRKLWPGYIKSFHLCAVSNDGTACRGDSGGPLVCVSDGRYFLRGVVSWGEGTCDVNNSLPTVYTRVSVYVDWIRHSINSFTPIG